MRAPRRMVCWQWTYPPGGDALLCLLPQPQMPPGSRALLDGTWILPTGEVVLPVMPSPEDYRRLVLVQPT